MKKKYTKNKLGGLQIIAAIFSSFFSELSRIVKKGNAKSRIWLLLFVVVILYVLYGFGRVTLNNILVDKNEPIITAVIINEENVYPNQRGIHPKFSYSYEFVVKNKKYKGDSHDPSLRIGDSVKVRYYKHCPYFNKPLYQKD